MAAAPAVPDRGAEKEAEGDSGAGLCCQDLSLLRLEARLGDF